MRDLVPGQPVPPDGADVLVVEGLGAGVGGSGCNPTLNEILYITLLAINSGQRTVTEITPQSSCSPDVNVWRYVLTSLVNQVIAGAPNSGTYWGGIMLNEEDGFWTTAPGSVAAYTELNGYVRDLMLGTPGISWYFTENFTGQGVWSQAQFNQITGTSHAAPQIASEYMITLTNSLQASSGKAMLVTWSLLYAGYATLYRAESRITGPPRTLWSLPLSNCFTTGTTPCGPDSDHDGLINSIETLLGTSPWVADTDADRCSDGAEQANQGIKEPDNPLDYKDFPDLRWDGRIGQPDVDLLSLIWNQRPGDPGWEADTNGNGVKDGVERDLDRNLRIGLGDTIIVSLALNRVCP